MVKVHSLKIKAPSASGPRTVRIFKNQPRSLDFSQAESFESIQVRLVLMVLTVLTVLMVLMVLMVLKV